MGVECSSQSRDTPTGVVVGAKCLHEVYEFLPSSVGQPRPCDGWCRFWAWDELFTYGDLPWCKGFDSPDVWGIERHRDWEAAGRIHNQRFAGLEQVVAAFREECARFGIDLRDEGYVFGSLPTCHPLCEVQKMFSYAMLTVLGVNRDQMQMTVGLPEVPDDMCCGGGAHDALLVTVDYDDRCAYQLMVHASGDEVPVRMCEQVAHGCRRSLHGRVDDVFKDVRRVVNVCLGDGVTVVDAERDMVRDVLERLFLSVFLPTEHFRESHEGRMHESSPLCGRAGADTPAVMALTVEETTDTGGYESSHRVGAWGGRQVSATPLASHGSEGTRDE